MALPQQAVEDTKRILNIHLERAVLATLDFALSAENRSFDSPELRVNLDRLLARDKERRRARPMIWSGAGATNDLERRRRDQ